MDVSGVLLIVLLAVASALCGVAIWALTEMVSTARSVRALADDTRERLVPLLDKTDVTVDAVNAELLRIDTIITRFEEASERVNSASGTLSDIVNAPAEIVQEFAMRARQAWKERKRAPEGSPHAATETADEEPVRTIDFDTDETLVS